MAADPKKSFLFRMDPKLWAELERWAGEDLRSVNAQIEFLLREAVKRRRGSAASEPAAAGHSAEASTPGTKSEGGGEAGSPE